MYKVKSLFYREEQKYIRQNVILFKIIKLNLDQHLHTFKITREESPSKKFNNWLAQSKCRTYSLNSIESANLHISIQTVYFLIRSMDIL